MAEKPDAPTLEARDDDEALKKRLLSRIALAGVIVVALLGGLTIIDALYVPPPPPRPAEPVAQAPEAKPEEKAEEKAVEEKVEVAQAEKKDEPVAEPEGTRSVGAPPPRPLRPLTIPATPHPAAIRPSAPAAGPARPEPATEIARTQPPSGPLAQHPAAARPAAPAAEGSRQFVVQMGVFNNVANAEDLRAKLEMAGVPVQIEARVQVGPFKSRQEADAAREKLRALGMDNGILTAIKR